MKFRVLGPLEVSTGEGVLSLGGVKQRAILAALVVRANEAVPLDLLVEAAWGSDAPTSARGLVRTYTSRLRKLLTTGEGAVELVATPAGHVLKTGTGQVDVHQFEGMVATARRHLEAGRHDEGSTVLGEALGLWRGEPLGDLGLRAAFRPTVARLEQLRVAAAEARIDAEMTLGRHGGVLGDLEILTARYPFHERFWTQRIVALYRLGRQAEALASYQDLRRRLAEELGIDPSPELRSLEQQVLVHADDLAGGRPGGISPRSRRTGGTVIGTVPLPPALVCGVRGETFVGRAGEQELLERLWCAARAGRFGAVLLGGAPGIGKSALVAKFARQAHAEGATVAFGRADPEGAVPGQAIREAVTGWAVNVPTDEVRRLAPVDIAHLATVVPALRQGTDRSGTPEVDDTEGRQSVFEALARWVGLLASNGPAVLLLEDLHWADELTLAAVLHLVRHPPSAGVVVLVTYRESVAGRSGLLAKLRVTVSRDPHVHRLELGGLTAAETIELLRLEATSWPGVPVETVAEGLNRSTGANPFFLREVWRHLAAHDLRALDVRTFTEGDPFGACDLPPEVTELVSSSLDRLPPVTIGLLQQASVIGLVFEVPVLARMAGLSTAAVMEALVPAATGQFVELTACTHFTFSNPLLRAAVGATTSLDVRTRTHWLAGEAIASLGAPLSSRSLGRVAHHLTAGVCAGDPQVAAAASVKAGDSALATWDIVGADAWYATATEILETTGVEDPELASSAWLGVARVGLIADDPARVQVGQSHAAAVARGEEWGPSRRAAVGVEAQPGVLDLRDELLRPAP